MGPVRFRRNPDRFIFNCVGYSIRNETTRLLEKRGGWVGACADYHVAHWVSMDTGNRAVCSNAGWAHSLANQAHGVLWRRRAQRIEQRLHDGQQLPTRWKRLLRHQG